MINNPGTASGPFADDAGDYRVDVDWVNEPDGVSKFAFLVNGAVVSTWSGIGGSDTIETQSIRVALAHNDKIEIRGTKGGGEYARIDSLTVREDGGLQTDLLLEATDDFVFADTPNAVRQTFVQDDGSDLTDVQGEMIEIESSTLAELSHFAETESTPVPEDGTAQDLLLVEPENIIDNVLFS